MRALKHVPRACLARLGRIHGPDDRGHEATALADGEVAVEPEGERRVGGLICLRGPDFGSGGDFAVLRVVAETVALGAEGLEVLE